MYKGPLDRGHRVGIDCGQGRGEQWGKNWDKYNRTTITEVSWGYRSQSLLSSTIPEPNESRDTTHQTLRDAAGAVLRRRTFIAINIETQKKRPWLV